MKSLVKVQTFWETHKIWKNHPHNYDKSVDLFRKRQNPEKVFSNYVCFSKSPNFNPVQPKIFEFFFRQIATLNEAVSTEESRESSAQPEEYLDIIEDSDQVLDKNVQVLNKSSTERSIPLVVAVAEAARNPRIRGKPSRLRDLQQPVPMEENINVETEPRWVSSLILLA